MPFFLLNGSFLLNFKVHNLLILTYYIFLCICSAVGQGLTISSYFSLLYTHIFSKIRYETEKKNLGAKIKLSLN